MQKIEIDQIEDGNNLLQTLTVGTAMGQLDLTFGGTVYTNSIAIYNKQDANSHPKNSGGLEAFSYNAPSAVNYPVVAGAGGGGGISFYRNNSAGGLLSSFDILKSEHSEEKLRFRVGISTTSKGGWKTFASEEYVDDAIAKVGLDLENFGGRNYLQEINTRFYTPYYQGDYSRGILTATRVSASVATYVITTDGLNNGDFLKGLFTFSGYVKINSAIPSAINISGSLNTQGGNTIFKSYDPVTGFFVATHNYTGNTTWFTHTNFFQGYINQGDILTIENAKFEKGSIYTDWTPAPEDQVSDWNETDNTKYSYIKNKPTLVNNYLDTILTTNGTTAGTVYTFKRVGLTDLSITLTAASASFSGVVTTGTQTFAGNKIATGVWTFNNNVIVNSASNTVSGLQVTSARQGGFAAWIENTDTGGSSNGLYVKVSNNQTNNTVQRWIVGNTEVARVQADGVLKSYHKISSTRLGFFGEYSSAQTQGIWSIGTGYDVSASTTTLGNQYGLAYSYIDVGGSSTTNRHQIHFVQNGTATVTIDISSQQVRAINGFIKPGITNDNMLLASGGHRPVSDFALISQVYTQAQALALFVGKTGVETIQDTKTFTHSPVVPNGTLNGHTVNLGQLNTILNGYALTSAIPTNNNQLTNGAGYITASALSGYVLQTSLNSQLANYVTVNGVQNITATKTFTVSPVVPNGTLSGHAVNKSQLDNAVTNGNTAYNQIVSLFSNLEKYKKVHTPTSGANIKTDEVFFTVVNTSSLSGGTINILDHMVDGARLVIQTINPITFTGRLMTAALAPLNSIVLENENKEYMWDADINRWREIF